MKCTMLLRLLLLLCCWLVATTSLQAATADNGLVGGIIGGKTSDIKKHPYHVTIVGGCSGAIIHKRWVLTLASCVTAYYADIKKYPIRTGSNSQTEGGQLYNVSKAVLHNKYNISTVMYNFALLKTSEPIKFNQFTKQIGFANRKSKVGSTGVLSGFGESNGNSKSVFKEVALKRTNFINCQKMYNNESAHVYDTMFCAASNDKVQGPCGYDYGDPLVTKNKLHGLFTLYVKCPAKEYPSIFAEVSSVSAWIKKTLSNK